MVVVIFESGSCLKVFFIWWNYMMFLFSFVSLLCEFDLLRWNPRIKLTFLSLQFQNWVINVWKVERGLRIPKKRSHLLSRKDPASSAILHFKNLCERGEENLEIKCNVTSTENWDFPGQHLRGIFASIFGLIDPGISVRRGWVVSHNTNDTLLMMIGRRSL